MRAFPYRYDVFISYSRSDAASYAEALGGALARDGYECFLDKEELPAGLALTPTLKSALASSRVLVVIASRAAVESKWVGLELSAFASTGRPIIPIAIESALLQSLPSSSLWSGIREKEFVWLNEDPDKLPQGEPSAHVVKGIAQLFRYTKRRVVRRRWITFAVFAIASAAIVAAWQLATARLNREIARGGAVVSVVRQLAAEDPAVAALALGSLSDAEPAGGSQLALSLLENPLPTLIRNAFADRLLDGRLVFSDDGIHVAVLSQTAGSVTILRADGHGDPIRASSLKEAREVEFVGRSQILTTSSDGVIRVWSIVGKPVRSLSADSVPMARAVPSPDGMYILGISKDRTRVLVWRMEHGDPPLRLRTNLRDIAAAAFNRSSSRIVVTSSSGDAEIYATWNTEPIATLLGTQEYVFDVGFTADSGRVVIASGSGTVRVWTADGVPASETYSTVDKEEAAKRIQHVELSADGSRVATVSCDIEVPTGCRDTTLSVWSLDGRRVTAAFDLKTDEPEFVTFSRDNRFILTHRIASETVDVYRLREDGTSPGGLPTVLRQRGLVDAAAFGDHARIAVASSDLSLRVWNLEPALPIVLPGAVRSSVISNVHRGRSVVSASDDGTARWWRTLSSAPTLLAKGHTGQIAASAIHPDGERVVTAGVDKVVNIWTSEGRLERSFRVSAEPSRVVYTAAGPYIAMHGRDGAPVVWSPDTAGERVVGQPYARDLALDSSATRLAHEAGRGEVHVTTIQEGAKAAIVQPNVGWGLSLAFDDSAARLAILSRGSLGRLVVWNLGTAEPALARNATGAEEVALSPDGTMVVTLGDSPRNIATVWKVDGTGDPLVIHSPYYFRAAALTDAGKQLIIAGGSVARWPLQWKDLRAVLRQTATGCLTAEERTRLLFISHEQAEADWRRCNAALKEQAAPVTE